MKESAFPETELSDEELLGTGLVAARSLLSEQRRGTRRGLLIDSVVAFLVNHGARTEKFVRDGVRRIWGTTTLTDALFEQAFEEACAAGLIGRTFNLDGDPMLDPTSTAAHEVAAEREWVALKLTQFNDEVQVRVIGYPKETELVRKSGDIAAAVIRAIAHGTSNANEADYAEGDLVRPVNIDVAAVRKFCNSLSEPTWREPVLHLTEAAFDTTDAFGDEIVHLLVVGSVVHGLIAQRALPAQPSLEGRTLLLDCSVLIGLAADRKDPERRMMTDLIGSSKRLGVRVCVASHTRAEWRGLWIGAHLEVKGHTDGDDLYLPPEVYPLIQNPFVRKYVEHLDLGGTTPWPKWANDHRDLLKLTRSLDVEFLPRTQLNERYQTFKSRLQELNKRKHPPRSPAAVEADARTCAIAEAWRTDGVITYFVTADTMTPAAYRDVTGDPLRLTVEPRGWLLYTANLLTDDPDNAIAVAELVGQVSVRNAIFDVASAIRLQDVIEFVSILKDQGSTVTPDDVRDVIAVQHEMFDSIDELQMEDAQDPRVRGAELARRVGARRIGRAEVERRRQDERERIHKRNEDRAIQRADDAERRTADALGEIGAKDAELSRLKRRTGVGAAALATALLLLGALLGGLIGLLGLVLGSLALVWWTLTALRWADQVDRRASDLARETIAVVTLELLVLIGGAIAD